MTDKQNTGTSEVILLEQDIIGFDYYVREVKKVIFVVLFVLLKEESAADEGLITEYLQVSVDYVQMCYFPFNPKIYFVWKATGFLDVIFFIFNILQIQTYLPSISYATFIVSVYILLVLILLIILDIVYVSYSFSRKRFTFMWPLQILRSVASFVVTVLYLPITETLLYTIQCQTNPETGDLALQSFPDVVCWQGWHIFHASLACLFTFIFTIICAIVAYAFFEPRMNSGNRRAREDTKGEVAFILNKVICQTLFSFLGEDQLWILVLVTFSLSLWLFIEYNYFDPFYDQNMSLFSQIISSFYLWTNLLLLLSTVFYTTDFNGGLVAWMLGFPFVVSIMLIKKQSRIDTLVRSQNKFRSGDQIQAHLRYVLQLIQNQEQDKNANMLLIGYMEKHKETCEEEDCPLKTKKSLLYKSSEKSINEQIRYLLQELDRMFRNGLKKFPDSTRLRLSYAFFLLERFKNKNRAYEQLVLAQQGKPAFYQQFIIYRYQKIIKENLDEENDQNSDIVSLIAYDNHISLCEEYIKLSSNLHKQFWAELKEDRPDLAKLNVLGSNISRSVFEAKDQYQKMQKINSSIPYTIRVFGQFVKHILNDRITGQELMKQSYLAMEVMKQEIKQAPQEPNLAVAPLPYIYVSAKKQNQGCIVSLNQLVTSYFGYQQEHLVGKNITTIMPNIYTSAHQNYVKRSVQTLHVNRDDLNDNEYFDVERLSYFKHCNGYLIPAWYRVMLNLEAMMFVATFRTESTMKSMVYFIVDRGWVIQEMSAGAITYFNLVAKFITSKPIRLDHIIPDIAKRDANEVYYQSFGMDGVGETYCFKREIEEIKVPVLERREDTSEDENVKAMTGYKLVKLEKIEVSENQLQQRQLSIKTKKQRATLSSIEKDMIMNPTPRPIRVNVTYYKQPLPSMYKTDTNPEIIPLRHDPEIDKDFLQLISDSYQTPRIDYYQELFEKIHEVGNQADIFNYGQDIITRRYINGQIVGVDEEWEEYNLRVLEEEEQVNSIFRKNLDNYDDEEDYKMLNHTNSNNLIRNVLVKQHSNDKIFKFRIHSALWIAIVIVISGTLFSNIKVMEYLYCTSYFAQYKRDIDVIQIINLKIIDLNNLANRVLDFVIAGEGLYGKDYELQEPIDLINEAVVETLQFNDYFNDPNYFGFYNRFNQNISIRIFTLNGGYYQQNMSFEASIMLISSYAQYVAEQPTSEHKMGNIYIAGITYNMFNTINNMLVDISAWLYNDISKRLSTAEVELLVLLVTTIVISTSSLARFFHQLLQIKKSRENILFLFLDIPKRHIQRLHRRCDKFIKGYVSMRVLMAQTEQEDVPLSTSGHEQSRLEKLRSEDEEDEMLSKKHRNKIISDYRAHQLKDKTALIPSFVVVAAVTHFFAIFNLISTNYERNAIYDILPQYYQTSFLMNHYAYYINLQKIMMLDYEYEIQGENIIDLVGENLKIFTGNTKKLREFTINLIDQGDSKLSGQFMQIYYGDICEILLARDDAKERFSECHYIINGTLQMGLVIMEQFYLEYFQMNLKQFITEPKKYSELLSSDMLLEIDASLYEYVDEVLSSFTEYEQVLIEGSMISSEQIQLLVLIIYSLVLVCLLFFVWMPYLTYLNNQINQTIQMLNMIPINVIRESKSIRRFIKDLIKSTDLRNQD